MTYTPLSEAQRRLTIAGFDDELVADDSRLRSTATGAQHDPVDLTPAEAVRVENPADPDEDCVVVAVAAPDGAPMGTFTTSIGPSATAEETAVLQLLYEVALEPDETSEHDTHDHIVGVFASEGKAESAIEDLRQAGLGSDRMGVAIKQGASAVFEHDGDADMARNIGVGMGAGAGLGVLGGLLLFGLAIPGVGLLGVGGLAVVGAGFGLGGGVLGGFAGVGVTAETAAEHQRLRNLPLDDGEVLIVACGHGHDALVEGIMVHHGGRLVSLDD